MILTPEAKQKLAQYKDEFLAVHPIPTTEEMVEGEISTPLYTPAEWLEEYTKQHFIRQLQVGKRKLLQQDNVIPAYDDLV